MEQVAKLKRIWNLALVLQIVQKITEIIVLTYIYQLAKLGDLMSYDSKDIFKNVPSHVLILTMTSQVW